MTTSDQLLKPERLPQTLWDSNQRGQRYLFSKQFTLTPLILIHLVREQLVKGFENLLRSV